MKILLVFTLLLFCETGFAQNVDINLLKSINQYRTISLDKPFIALTNSTYPVSLAIPTLLFATGYSKKDSLLKRNALQMGAALVFTAVITEGLKYTIKRDRPFVKYSFIENAAHENGYSFPSGHVSVAFATATSISIAFPKWYVIAPSYLWAGSIAYSRMHLGAHYPSDVLAGALVGGGSSYLAHRLQKWVVKTPFLTAHKTLTRFN